MLFIVLLPFLCLFWIICAYVFCVLINEILIFYVNTTSYILRKFGFFSFFFFGFHCAFFLKIWRRWNRILFGCIAILVWRILSAIYHIKCADETKNKRLANSILRNETNRHRQIKNLKNTKSKRETAICFYKKNTQSWCIVPCKIKLNELLNV